VPSALEMLRVGPAIELKCIQVTLIVDREEGVVQCKMLLGKDALFCLFLKRKDNWFRVHNVIVA